MFVVVRGEVERKRRRRCGCDVLATGKSTVGTTCCDGCEARAKDVGGIVAGAAGTGSARRVGSSSSPRVCEDMVEYVGEGFDLVRTFYQQPLLERSYFKLRHRRTHLSPFQHAAPV